MVDELEDRNIKVIKSVKKSTNPIAYIPFYIDSFFKSINKDVDLFQAEYIPHSCIIPALMKGKKPFILKFHGDDGLIYPFKNRFNRALIDFSLKRADHVITCSENLKNTIISLGYDRDKITAIPNGVDTELFRPMNKTECRKSFNLPEEDTICLFAGRIHPMKGIKEIIDSAIENPDILFVLGGPGIIQEYSKNCIFLGDIPPKRMPELMNAADFLILPSYSEGFGLVLIESLACGVPVIASNVGGCPEIIGQNEYGILIHPHDVKALSKAVRFFEDDPKRRIEIGRAGREEVIKRYDSKKMTDKLIKIHENLIQIRH